MASNIYGVCTGTSSGKYDFWATVMQNSRNTEENKSNITVKLHLKRNDGNSSSAYNLYESNNSVSIEICGEKKVSKNIAIDTRNCATVTLATFTGDIPHNDDGSLELSVKANFTMGNTTLSGGSLEGSVKCISIVRASSAEFDVSSVNPGSEINFTVNPASSDFTHRLELTLGEASESIELKKGILSASFTVPLLWAEQVKRSSSASVSAVLYTYNGDSLLGSKNYDIKFIIPSTDEYKPYFDISITKNNGDIPGDIDSYIKGVTEVTVEPSSLAFKYGAEIAAVTMTVGNVTIRRMPATFPLNSFGEVLVTVAVRDTRGMLTVKTETINVLDYEKPSVGINSVFRCNSSGIYDALGTNLKLSYQVGYSDLGGKNEPTVTLKYRRSSDSTVVDLGTVEESPIVFGEGSISTGSTYLVSLSVTDRVTDEEYIVERYVSGGTVPFNIRKGGTGASFGKFSEVDELLDIGWDMRVEGDLEIQGQLNRENIECICTSNTTSMVSKSRFYPHLDLAFLRFRVDLVAELPANSSCSIAVVKDKAPGVFTPLNIVANYGGVNYCTGGIMYGTGEVVFRSDAIVPAGSRIYVSGFYIADYE